MSSSMQKAARRYLKEDPSRYERWREALPSRQRPSKRLPGVKRASSRPRRAYHAHGAGRPAWREGKWASHGAPMHKPLPADRADGLGGLRHCNRSPR
eukprot:scaffold76417_cov39-Tisochrysis_lutea.AAC.4